MIVKLLLPLHFKNIAAKSELKNNSKFHSPAKKKNKNIDCESKYFKLF